CVQHPRELIDGGSIPALDKARHDPVVQLGVRDHGAGPPDVPRAIRSETVTSSSPLARRPLMIRGDAARPSARDAISTCSRTIDPGLASCRRHAPASMPSQTGTTTTSTRMSRCYLFIIIPLDPEQTGRHPATAPSPSLSGDPHRA